MPCIAIIAVEYRPSTWPRMSARVWARSRSCSGRLAAYPADARKPRVSAAGQRRVQQEHDVRRREQEPQRLDQPGARRGGQHAADEDVPGQHPGRGDGQQVARRVRAERDEQRLAAHHQAVRHAAGEEDRAEQRRAEQRPVDLMGAAHQRLAGHARRVVADARYTTTTATAAAPAAARNSPDVVRATSSRPPSPYPATCMPPTAMLSVARPKT